MARSYKAKGLILRRTNVGEADRIFVFLSSTGGKIHAKARSVRKEGSKLAPHLELFNTLELMFAKGKGIDVLTGARLIKSYNNLLQDIEVLQRGWLMLEMVDKLTREPSKNVYQVVTTCLSALDGGISPSLIELWFKLRLLTELGYEPDLAQNIKSQAEIGANRQYFSPSSGGLVSRAELHSKTQEITEDHLKLWRLIQALPINKISKIGGTEKAAKESLPIANDFYDYLFGKRFHSSEI